MTGKSYIDYYWHVSDECLNNFLAFSQTLEQQAGASGDPQEIASEEKGAFRRKFSMDTVLEDKICDLYDLFVDVLILLPTCSAHA